ncbi:MAG: hypothetical protein K2J73_08510 [Oscillospiraceae bacterium]|nr:hypothetical protein [Oscillospiraceae bacterium]
MARSKSERLLQNGYPLNLLTELSGGSFVKTITLNDCACLEYLLNKNLTELQYSTLLLRYRFKLTCEMCGKLLNCSRQAVAQYENVALSKLRELKEICGFLATGKFDIIEKSAKTEEKALSNKELDKTVNDLKSEVEKLSRVSDTLAILDCVRAISGEKTYFTLHKSVEGLGFSVRTYNCLVRNNIKCVADILYKWNDLPKLRNLGVFCAWEIMDKMYELGFKVPKGTLETDD